MPAYGIWCWCQVKLQETRNCLFYMMLVPAANQIAALTCFIWHWWQLLRSNQHAALPCFIWHWCQLLRSNQHAVMLCFILHWCQLPRFNQHAALSCCIWHWCQLPTSIPYFIILCGIHANYILAFCSLLFYIILILTDLQYFSNNIHLVFGATWHKSMSEMSMNGV